MWPAVDRERRARAFAELRRRQAHAEAHLLTPAERLSQVDDIAASFLIPVVPGRATSSDESPDVWLRLLTHLRACR